MPLWQRLMNCQRTWTEVDPVEFSKKITLWSWAVALVLTLLAVVFPLFDISIEGINMALPLSWAEVTAANSFYFWKAKNENRHKYAMRYIKKIADEHGIEMSIRVSEIVLKD